MDSVITRALDNKKLKKKKSPKNRSLKDEYAKFLKKDASKARRKLKKPSLKKKVNITEMSMDLPLLICISSVFLGSRGDFVCFVQNGIEYGQWEMSTKSNILWGLIAFP